MREAWDNYKVAQDRAAFREAELQDEMKALQKAKLQEKQQMVAQLAKMSEEVAGSVKQVQAAQQERDAVQLQLEAVEEDLRGWRGKVQQLEQELLDARNHTVQGVQTLREELQQALASADQMRRDHAAVTRASQQRQAELEKENLELATSLSEKQKEVNRLLGLSGSASKDSAAGGGGGGGGGGGDYVSMQQELILISRKLEDETERADSCEQRARLLECEVRAQQLTAEEDRRRAAALAEQLSSQVASLEEKLRQQQETSRRLRYSSVPISSWPSALSSDPPRRDEEIDRAEDGQVRVSGAEGVQEELSLEEYRRMEKELAETKAQSQNISKLLLKKQGSLLEVQAEKAALKSRLADAEARY